MSIAVFAPTQLTVAAQIRRQRFASTVCCAAIGAIAVLVAGICAITSDSSAALAFSLLILAAALIAWQPRLGLFFIAFFAVAGDAETMPWYPFNKNLSSAESVMFLADSAIFSPLEICIGITYVAWVAHQIASHRRGFEKGAMLLPVLAFTGFVVAGMVRGLSSGGDRTAALYEARALFYLPALYVLATNLLSRKRHYQIVFGAVIAGITVNALFALESFLSLSQQEKLRLDSLGEHGASLAANIALLAVVVGWLYRTTPLLARIGAFALAMPIGAAYLVAQRRSAIGGLIVAGLAIFAGLFVVNRDRFWRVVPVVAILAVGYTAVFWNASGSLGFPAQAVKSVVAPDKVSAADRSSDQYRRIEAVDIVYTINTDPIRGLGFGQRFLRPIPLPAISDFVTAEYQPHNSFLWFWIKTGVFGFMTLLYLLGSLIQRGARAALGARDELSHVTMLATLYVMMFAAFTYLDISWDARTMVIFALSVSLIGNVDRLRAPEAELEPSRQ